MLRPSRVGTKGVCKQRESRCWGRKKGTYPSARAQVAQNWTVHNFASTPRSTPRRKSHVIMEILPEPHKQQQRVRKDTFISFQRLGTSFYPRSVRETV